MIPAENKSIAAAVILAAGQSKRMGSPKLVLPWGEGTVIGHVVRTLKEAGLGEIVVVTGGAAPLIETALASLEVRVLRNPNYVSGEMLTSCQIGLGALSSQVAAALIALGDQPQIEAGIVKSIIRIYAGSRPALVVPSYQMHRGHPWLVARSLWPDIINLRPPKTLRDFLTVHAGQIEYLPVRTASVLQDLDTPADYDLYSRSR
jgi:molybdenum cofactor cytidylyltransferase